MKCPLVCRHLLPFTRYHRHSRNLILSQFRFQQPVQQHEQYAAHFHPFLLFRLQDHFPNLSEAHSEHDIEVAEYDYQSDSNRDVERNLICEDLVTRHDPTVNEHHVA